MACISAIATAGAPHAVPLDTTCALQMGRNVCSGSSIAVTGPGTAE
jgi:hypothetical protein